MSTAYHLQTDGLVERFHRSVEQVLHCYCSGKQDKWCPSLSQREFALNFTYQDAVNDVPFKIIYGFNPALPLDRTLSNLKVPASGNMVAACRCVQMQVKKLFANAQIRMEGLINPKRRPLTFAIGDLAWLSTQYLPVKHGARKLAAKWAGPYRVVECIGAEVYRLQLPTAWPQHDVFHTS